METFQVNFGPSYSGDAIFHILRTFPSFSACDSFTVCQVPQFGVDCVPGTEARNDTFVVPSPAPSSTMVIGVSADLPNRPSVSMDFDITFCGPTPCAKTCPEDCNGHGMCSKASLPPTCFCDSWFDGSNCSTLLVLSETNPETDLLYAVPNCTEPIVIRPETSGDVFVHLVRTSGTPQPRFCELVGSNATCPPQPTPRPNAIIIHNATAGMTYLVGIVADGTDAVDFRAKYCGHSNCTAECPGDDCSSRGVCLAGTCTCDTGWKLPGCEMPVLSVVTTSGVSSDCNEVLEFSPDSSGDASFWYRRTVPFTNQTSSVVLCQVSGPYGNCSDPLAVSNNMTILTIPNAVTGMTYYLSVGCTQTPAGVSFQVYECTGSCVLGCGGSNCGFGHGACIRFRCGKSYCTRCECDVGWNGTYCGCDPLVSDCTGHSQVDTAPRTTIGSLLTFLFVAVGLAVV